LDPNFGPQFWTPILDPRPDFGPRFGTPIWDPDLSIILYRIAKNVVVDVVLLGRLWGQYKGLHEPSHRSVVVEKPNLGP
jgi:hypothetical protein